MGFCMKKVNIFNRSNTIIIILLIILSFIILFGMSYYIGITKFWNKMTTNHYLFRTYVVNRNDTTSKEEMIKRLKESPYILDAYTNDEYMMTSFIDEFKRDGKDGNIQLMGTIPNTKKIIYGKDLNKDNKYEIICPSDFFPDSIYANNSYNLHKSIDLKDRIDTEITLEFLKTKKEKFTLVGLYDRGHDYSSPNECYISHETMQELNDELKDKIYEQIVEYFNDPTIKPEDIEGNNIFILIDDSKNIDSILDIPGVTGYEKANSINTYKGDKILKITGILSIIMIWIVFILSLLIYKRKIMKDYKNIGIMIITGYSIKSIKKYKYKETIYLSILSFLISLVLSAISLKLYKTLFLYTDPELVLTPLNLSIVAIIISITITLLTSFLSTHYALKKIDEMEVLDIIYE